MAGVRRVGSNSAQRAKMIPSSKKKKAAPAPKGRVAGAKGVNRQSVSSKVEKKRGNRPSKTAKAQDTKKAVKPQKRKKVAKTMERQAKKARVLPVKRHTVTHASHPKVRVYICM